MLAFPFVIFTLLSLLFSSFVDQFPLRPQLTPHHELVNLCFAYPMRADLSKWFAAKEARGMSTAVVVRMSLHDADRDPAQSGLAVFFGENGTLTDNFTTSMCVAPANKLWSWHDECKVQLPLNVKETLHVRVVLLSLESSGAERMLGWTSLPIAAAVAQPQHQVREGGREGKRNLAHAF